MTMVTRDHLGGAFKHENIRELAENQRRARQSLSKFSISSPCAMACQDEPVLSVS